MDIDAVADALNAGKTSIGRPVIGRKLLAPLFGMATPIRDAKRDVIGALVGVVNLELPNFLDIALDGAKAKSGEISIASPSHNVWVTTSGKKRILEPLPIPGSNPLFDEIRSGFEGSRIGLDRGGAETLFSVKSIPEANWIIISALRSERVFAPVRRVERHNLIGAGILIAFAALCLWWLLWRQLMPLIVSAQALAKFQDVDSIQPLPIARDDEIGQLIGHFNRVLARLSQSKDHFQSLFHEAPIGIAVTDSLTGRYCEINPAFEKITGKSKEELSRTDWMAITHPDDIEKNHEYQALMNAEKISGFHFEKRYIRPDGSIVWISLTVARLRGDDISQPRHLSMIEDITERKRAEQIQKDSIDALVKSNADLERFAHAASHDLQEPVRSLIAYSQLLKRKCGNSLSGEGSEFVEIIIKSAWRMSELVNGLLSYSRINADITPRHDVDMKHIFRNALEHLYATVDASGAEIDIDELPVVLGDEVQLLQLAINLVGNAVKYVRPGDRPRVNISSCQDGREWIFAIKDFGIGIDMKYHSRVFEIFKRLHTQQIYPGAGIGLALCKRIVERHNGRIWFESDGDGLGTVFKFALPVAQVGDYAI